MATVMTWNLENLFLPEDTEDDRRRYREKLTGLASVIAEADPDLLGVQEVGEPEAFADLIAELGQGWHGELSTHPDDRGIRVGWLSRRALHDVEQIVDLPQGLSPVRVGDSGEPSDLASTMGRGALAVTTTTRDGLRLRAATCHLKSKLLTFPGGRFSTGDEDLRSRYGVYALQRRAVEAATVRAWVTRTVTADVPVLVCGDLNDLPEAATTQLLLGPPGSELGTAGFDQPDQGDAQRLWNVAPVIAPEQAWTRVNQGRHELIDHVLVSRDLVRRLVGARAVTTGNPPSVDAYPRSASSTSAPSDHRALVATFATD